MRSVCIRYYNIPLLRYPLDTDEKLQKIPQKVSCRVPGIGSGNIIDNFSSKRERGRKPDLVV